MTRFLRPCRLILACFHSRVPACQTDYDTPKKRGALVGPFVVSQPLAIRILSPLCHSQPSFELRLTAMALGNHTLPAEAIPDKDSKPFEPAARVTPAPAPAPEPVPVPVPAVDVASVESTPEATPFTAPVMPAPPMDVAMDVAWHAPCLVGVASSQAPYLNCRLQGGPRRTTSLRDPPAKYQHLAKADVFLTHHT